MQHKTIQKITLLFSYFFACTTTLQATMQVVPYQEQPAQLPDAIDIFFEAVPLERYCRNFDAFVDGYRCLNGKIAHYTGSVQPSLKMLLRDFIPMIERGKNVKEKRQFETFCYDPLRFLAVPENKELFDKLISPLKSLARTIALQDKAGFVKQQSKHPFSTTVLLKLYDDIATLQMRLERLLQVIIPMASRSLACFQCVVAMNNLRFRHQTLVHNYIALAHPELVIHQQQNLAQNVYVLDLPQSDRMVVPLILCLIMLKRPPNNAYTAMMLGIDPTIEYISPCLNPVDRNQQDLHHPARSNGTTDLLLSITPQKHKLPKVIPLQGTYLWIRTGKLKIKPLKKKKNTGIGSLQPVSECTSCTYLWMSCNRSYLSS